MGTTTLFTAENVVVGAGNVYISGQATSLAAVPGSTVSQLLLNPITDATKFTIGDVVTVGAQVETPRVSKIDYTLGILYLESDLGAVPTDQDVVTVLWRNLGATDGDINVTGQITLTEQYVDQTIFPVKAVRTKGEFGVDAPMADQSLENLAAAMGADESLITTSGGIRTLPLGTTQNLREDRYLVTGFAPGTGLFRTFLLHRGVSGSALALKHSKTNKQITTLKIMGLFSTPDAELGVAKDGNAFVYVF